MMRLNIEERVYLVNKVTTGSNNSATLPAMAAPWKLANDTLQALVALTPAQIPTTLSQPVKLRWPINQLHLPGRVQLRTRRSFSGQPSQQLPHLPVERRRIAHVPRVRHVKLVSVIDLAEEFGVWVLEQAVVVPDDRVSVVGTSPGDIVGGVEDAVSADGGGNIAAAESDSVGVVGAGGRVVVPEGAEAEASRRSPAGEVAEQLVQVGLIGRRVGAAAAAGTDVVEVILRRWVGSDDDSVLLKKRESEGSDQ